MTEPARQIGVTWSAAPGVVLTEDSDPDLVGTALAVLAEARADGWPRLEVTFKDASHAEWALWQVATNAEALAPQWLRNSLRDRAAAIATCYGGVILRVVACCGPPQRGRPRAHRHRDHQLVAGDRRGGMTGQRIGS